MLPTFLIKANHNFANAIFIIAARDSSRAYELAVKQILKHCESETLDYKKQWAIEKPQKLAMYGKEESVVVSEFYLE